MTSLWMPAPTMSSFSSRSEVGLSRPFALFREWLEQGLATLEAYLAKHAAFVDYLEAEPST